MFARSLQRFRFAFLSLGGFRRKLESWKSLVHGRTVLGDDDGDSVPLPLDHFFFCFLPPVDAAGACHVSMLVVLVDEGAVWSLTILTVGVDVRKKRATSRPQVRN
jgi:hypothetical protein